MKIWDKTHKETDKTKVTRNRKDAHFIMADMETTTTTMVTVTDHSFLENMPESIIHEIFLKLEPEKLMDLCSVACVSKTLHSSVNKALSSLSSFDLSAFSLDSQTIDGIVKRFGKLKKITLDCLRLSDSSVTSFLGPDVEELVLLKCGSLSYELLASIGTTCPNLRLLTLEFYGRLRDDSVVYNLIHDGSLGNCACLESLIIKFDGRKIDDLYSFFDTLFRSNRSLLGDNVGSNRSMLPDILPQNVKVLKLERVSASDTLVLLKTFAKTNVGVPATSTNFGKTLTHLSLVLDFITDALVHAIACCLPLLVELDLTDEPTHEPVTSHDLSNSGFLSLVRHCRHLTSTSLIRNRYSFKRTTDQGMILLAKGCEELESVQLSGFSKVTDVGFTSVIHSCLNLKKFVIQNAFHLTDLSFRNVSKVPRSLIEVKVVSCKSITSKSVLEFAACNSLEVLDFTSCKGVTDFCIGNVSCLTSLTSLKLGWTYVTDAGMAVLGKGNAPISCLFLRGCKGVTDKGISFLLQSEGKIRKTLSSLDLSYMPGITDNAIITIVVACVGLTELCIRNCFHVTDASVMALALGSTLHGECKHLRRLDLYNCTALSAESLEFFKKPLFRGLQWIGIGQTQMFCGDRAARLAEIRRERPWLFICTHGCEMGCHDKWKLHAENMDCLCATMPAMH